MSAHAAPCGCGGGLLTDEPLDGSVPPGLVVIVGVGVRWQCRRLAGHASPSARAGVGEQSFHIGS